MLTFNQIYTEVQNQTQDFDDTTLVVIKQAINQGMRKFGAILHRDWRLTERTFSLVASQQYYQMPEDAIRIKSVVVTVGDVSYPLREIADKITWDDLNMNIQTGSVPEFFYVKGSDQFGIWPIPSANLASGGLLTFEPSMRDMRAADYTTGTIAITNGSADVVGAGTTFTAAMVGRVLFVDNTGSTGDGAGYKIASFTDTTHITLENSYAGVTSGTSTFTIGEVPDIPEEFHESLVDYAAYRYYLRRRDTAIAKDFNIIFREALMECQANYSSKTSSQYTRPVRVKFGYAHQYRDQRIA